MKKSTKIIAASGATIVAVGIFGAAVSEEGSTATSPVVNTLETETPVTNVLPETVELPEPTQAPATAEITTTTPEPEPEPELTRSQEGAIRDAENYLRHMDFSYQGLIDQLSSEYGEGHTLADAQFAVDYVSGGPNAQLWFDEAADSAESYYENGIVGSRQAMIEQLTSEYGEQFTYEQAVFAVDELGL